MGKKSHSQRLAAARKIARNPLGRADQSSPEASSSLQAEEIPFQPEPQPSHQGKSKQAQESSSSEEDSQRHPRRLERSQPSQSRDDPHRSGEHSGRGSPPSHHTRHPPPPRVPSSEEIARAITTFMEFMQHHKPSTPQRTPPLEMKGKEDSSPPRKRMKARREDEVRGKGKSSHSRGLEGPGEDSSWKTSRVKRKHPEWFSGYESCSRRNGNEARPSVHDRLGARKPSMQSRLQHSVHSRLTCTDDHRPPAGSKVAASSTQGGGESALNPSSKGKAVMILTSSPFASWIVEAKVPTVKIPAHITYDGTSDPKEHVSAYESHMYLNPLSEATWCKYFPTTLKGVAQAWITKGIERGSIRSWDDLVQKFKSKFATANRREKTTAELMSVTQNANESLRDYLTRFSNESSRITSLDQSLAVFSLTNGLREGIFRDELVMYPPRTLEDALGISDKFIRAEEWNKSKSSSAAPEKGKGQQSEGGRQ